MRLTAKAGGTPPRLMAIRAAHPSYTLADFNTNRVTAALKQAAFAGSGKPPLVVVALGTNDALSAAPALINSRALTLIASLKAAGVTRIAALLPARPSVSWTFPAGSSYDAAIGALSDAYRAQGVAMIRTNAVDWAGENMTGDGIHPNDLGYERMALLVTEALAG
jgi:lysophospholipase L1-like esterase